MTHIVPATARPVGRDSYRALCGALVHGWEHAANGEPECKDCARLDAEDEQSILSLSQTTAHDFGGPPEKYQPFDPTAGYRRRR